MYPFCVTAASNRGLSTKAFLSEAEALGWLQAANGH
jgi:hypothetical protein